MAEMSLPSSVMIAAFLAMVVLRTGVVCGGECINAELCTEPCPAQNSCPNGDADCAEDMWCVPSCLPSVCICVPQSDSWNCTWDCAGECEERPVWTGPPEYLIIPLGTLGGWVSVALGVNDCGQVVGGADTAHGARHPFLWDAGEMIDLGTLPGITHCEAWDINNNSQVVGLCVDYYGGGERAFLWEDGEMIDLGDLGGGEADADAINDAGQVVGNSHVSRTDVHSFLWEDGVMTDLTETIGVNAIDINNLGHLAGSVVTKGQRTRSFWTGSP